MSELIVEMPLAPAPPAHRRAFLLSETGVKVEFRWTPPDSATDGDAATFGQIDRPGLKPISRRAASGLRTWTGSPTFGNADPEISCEPDLAVLRALADSGERVQWVYGALEQGWWNITAMPITVITRVEGTNDVSRCTIGLTLTEANDVRALPGRTSTAAAVATTSAWSTVKVSTGDTLYRLATQYLGSGPRWTEIAKANNISNPSSSTALTVGTTLKIPPR